MINLPQWIMSKKPGSIFYETPRALDEMKIIQHLDDMDNRLGDLVDDLSDIHQHLREIKSYAEADRLRTLMGRIARLRRVDFSEPEETLRAEARGWK